jgi:hypothetical protein
VRYQLFAGDVQVSWALDGPQKSMADDTQFTSSKCGQVEFQLIVFQPLIDEWLAATLELLASQLAAEP